RRLPRRLEERRTAPGTPGLGGWNPGADSPPAPLLAVLLLRRPRRLRHGRQPPGRRGRGVRQGWEPDPAAPRSTLEPWRGRVADSDPGVLERGDAGLRGRIRLRRRAR